MSNITPGCTVRYRLSVLDEHTNYPQHWGKVTLVGDVTRISSTGYATVHINEIITNVCGAHVAQSDGHYETLPLVDLELVKQAAENIRNR